MSEPYSFVGSNVYLRKLTDDDVNQEHLSWFTYDVVQQFVDSGARKLIRQEIIDYR
jgi:hypothetical protein